MVKRVLKYVLAAFLAVGVAAVPGCKSSSPTPPPDSTGGAMSTLKCAKAG